MSSPCKNPDCEEPTCQEHCPHDDHDHAMCISCGLDRSEHFAAAAEAAFEGDR